jgi:hypothetical protein
MNETQAWFIVVEVGIIALAALLQIIWYRGPRP